jgi:hypothetical protein
MSWTQTLNPQQPRGPSLGAIFLFCFHISTGWHQSGTLAHPMLSADIGNTRVT